MRTCPAAGICLENGTEKRATQGVWASKRAEVGMQVARVVVVVPREGAAVLAGKAGPRDMEKMVEILVARGMAAVLLAPETEVGV